MSEWTSRARRSASPSLSEVRRDKGTWAGVLLRPFLLPLFTEPLRRLILRSSRESARLRNLLVTEKIRNMGDALPCPGPVSYSCGGKVLK